MAGHLLRGTTIAQARGGYRKGEDNVLTLVGPTPRGGPGHTMPKARRSMRMLGVPHFEINDAIMAEEVQGVRPFGEGRPGAT